MVRKLFKMAVVALSMVPLAGLHSPVKALTTTPVPYANSFVSDNSWAGVGNMPALIVGLRGQSIAGNVSGNFSVASANWSAMGGFLSQTDYTDATRQHIEVTAYVYFSTAQAPNSYIPAFATFRAAKQPNGSCAEGVEIVDMRGAVLGSTGRDANGALILLPIMRGSLIVSH